MWGCRTALVLLASALVAAGCSRTTLVDDVVEGRPGPMPRPEECNGLDDDLDGLVAAGVLDGGGMDPDLFIDEDFRDEQGRYIDDDHCGACNQPCRPDGPEGPVLEARCGLIEEAPACVATRCARGFTISSSGRCIPAFDRLCALCIDDDDCGDVGGATCTPIGGERRCAVGCDRGCPEGYSCVEDRCLPAGGSCSCEPGDDFTLACALFDPEGLRCPGMARCVDGDLGECVAPEEVCDGTDNDCNGIIDDGFRDARGAYSLDVRNCGQCGVDCTASEIPEGDLTCGGDPFAPTCVLLCPDTLDGIMPGDRVDADGDISTGCECTVQSLDDAPGPIGAEGENLDENCDGADGIVVESFYVAPDGNDAGPGSPTRPLRTIDVGLARAAASLDTAMPRPHVFVASGVYTETLNVPDGVFLHGGYRRDFRALDPTGFRVEVRAPSTTTAPGGAAIEIRGAGVRPTVIEWITVQGVDAAEPADATFGVYALDPGPELIMREMTVRAGVPGAGASGMNGAAGRSFTAAPGVGQAPRVAIESAVNTCVPGADNTVVGGAGGRNTCGGVDVSGGAGGSARCPSFATFQPAGVSGNPAGGRPGGGGGAGGQDSQGPIFGPSSSCPSSVCCGLADYTVPTDFRGPEPGSPGSDGSNGGAGTGCTEPFGRFEGDDWIGQAPGAGTAGGAGSGGGGGGAGGGVEVTWTTGCEWPDGLGGGGGGGGAGGCGGGGGRAGQSGAPSVAVLLRYTAGRPASFPELRDVLLGPSDGGRGGDGGAGGAGGRGEAGGIGGDLPIAERTIFPLGAPFPGGRGGPGGNGGSGGGGGGGCGGASVGVWILGIGTTEPPEVAVMRSSNVFELGRPGRPGRGGGGAAPGGDGAEGGAVDVVVR